MLQEKHEQELNLSNEKFENTLLNLRDKVFSFSLFLNKTKIIILLDYSIQRP